MLLAKSALILNENETMSYLCHSQETQADRHAASSPSKGQNSQLTHVLGTSTTLLQTLSHVGSQKSTYTAKLRHNLYFCLQKLFSLDTAMAWGLSDFSSQSRFQIGILHPASLKDVRNPTCF